jgi:hypothetical protein
VLISGYVSAHVIGPLRHVRCSFLNVVLAYILQYFNTAIESLVIWDI